MKPVTEAQGLLPWEWAEERLAVARNDWIASTKPDGRPHVMPVWGVWLDGALLFATDRISRKGKNLAANPFVVVHLESGDEAVILEGRALEVTDPAALRSYAAAYEAKYAFRPDVNEKGNVTLGVRPKRAFAWKETDFPSSPTRWEFDS
jgi:nitroimidazol reductase NimA-like FMN-containing flavoprotein (pyridoxamine 5'-phosphate oxidase superfamily)